MRFLAGLLTMFAGACALSHHGSERDASWDSSEVFVDRPGVRDAIDVFGDAHGDEVAADVAFDVEAEVGVDAVDIPGDMQPDVPVDRPVDIGAEVTDAGVDVRTDVGTDAQDVAADVPADAGGPILSVDLTTLAGGAAISLPGGLRLTRGSSATVQTGTNTVVTTGITANVARVGRRLDTVPLGLVLEEARTNLLQDSTPANARQWAVSNGYGATWTTGSPPGPDVTVPAGVTGWSSTSGSRFAEIPGSGGSVFSWSGWLQRGGLSDNNVALSWGDGTTWATAVVLDTVATSAWNRRSIQFTAAATNRLGFGTDGRTPYPLSSTQAVNSTLWQYEAGSWPSEAIVTTGAAATREGEHLYLAPVPVVAGRLSFSVSLSPKAAPGSYASAMRLWTSGADYAELANTGILTVSIGGVANATSTALIWAQYDVLDLYVAAGGGIATVVSYRVNLGRSISPTVTGSALRDVSMSASLDLLCNGTVAQFSAWIYRIDFYLVGGRPSWG